MKYEILGAKATNDIYNENVSPNNKKSWWKKLFWKGV